MITYKDMTFCPFWEECRDGPECPRALTKDIYQRAEAIGLPVSRFVTEPECFREERRE
jgi:hypothetical protein